MESLFPTESSIPVEHSQQFVEQHEYLIGGELKIWNGPTQEVLSAICIRDGTLKRQKLGSYPMLTATESNLALDAATLAYNRGKGEWPTMSVKYRIRHVQEFVFKMKKVRSQVVNMLMWEIGKSLQDSEKEFDRTVEYIVDTIDALKDLDRVCSRFQIEQGIAAQIRRAPLGVVLCMGPYNYPLNETFTTLIPALIMGNCVIFKPPKYGVLLHRPLLEAFATSFPPGVVNTVYGDGAVICKPLMTSGRVDVLAFIGSCRVGDILKSQHPKPHKLRCVLALEAKNAGIVLEDADIDNTVKECVLGSLSFNGQRCTAIKILFVHTKIYDEFVQKMSTSIDNLKIGMPWEKGVFITPLVDVDRVQMMKDYVTDALKFGGKLLNNGNTSAGTLYHPSFVELDPTQMSNTRLYHDEQFGPVVPIVRYDNVDVPVDYIINSNLGQQVAIFGNNADILSSMIDPLVNQVCRVNINSTCQRGPDKFPFTGRKDSAEGTLSVSDALRVFSIRTLVAAKATEQNKELLEQILRDRKSRFLTTDFLF